MDNSNIFIGAQNEWNKTSNKMDKNPAVRLNVDKLADVIERKRTSADLRTRIVGGSEPPRNARVWQEWTNRGYRVLLGERSASNKVCQTFTSEEDR